MSVSDNTSEPLTIWMMDLCETSPSREMVVVDWGAAENVMPRSMLPEIGMRQTARYTNGKGFKRTWR